MILNSFLDWSVELAYYNLASVSDLQAIVCYTKMYLIYDYLDILSVHAIVYEIECFWFLLVLDANEDQCYHVPYCSFYVSGVFANFIFFVSRCMMVMFIIQ